MIDERTEQLINRRLDGELREGETLELDKALIRSPEARAMDEELQAIDVWAGQTLHTLLDEPRLSPEQLRSITTKPRRNWHRLAQYGLSAAAAVLFLIASAPLLPRAKLPSGTQSPVPGHDPYVASAVPTSPQILISNPNAEPSDLAGVVTGPREYQKQIDQDVIGVFDPDTQSVYLLELETAHNRVRSMRANY